MKQTGEPEPGSVCQTRSLNVCCKTYGKAETIQEKPKKG